MRVLDLNSDPHVEMTGTLLTEPSLQSLYPDFLESKVAPKEWICTLTGEENEGGRKEKTSPRSWSNWRNEQILLIQDF